MANPSLAMIPSGYKAGKLYSVLPQDGTGDFTVVSDQKYVTGSTGLLELVPANTPAFDYSDGSGCPALLVEGVSTNLLTYSEDFSNPSWTKNSLVLTPNYGLAPNGTLSSTRIIFSGGYIFKSVLNYTNESTSIYIKGKLGEKIAFGKAVSVGGGDLYTLTGDWQRLEYLSSNSGTAIVINDFAAGTTAHDIEVWGAQLEVGTEATSYIPTTTTSVTRAADIETVTTPSGVTSITETIGGVEQTPITVIPTTYQIPNGLINKITMI